MPIDEKEPNSSVGISRGRQASEQQGTFTADYEWNVTVADRLSDQSTNCTDHCCKVGRRDKSRGWISLRVRFRQCDVSVVVDVGNPLQRLDQPSSAEGCRSAGFAPGQSG